MTQTLKRPVRFTADVEQVAPDEGETFESLNRTFDEILESTAQDYGHAVRAVHAKAHGVVRGELWVAEGLPPELAQGLFAGRAAMRQCCVFRPIRAISWTTASACRAGWRSSWPM